MDLFTQWELSWLIVQLGLDLLKNQQYEAEAPVAETKQSLLAYEMCQVEWSWEMTGRR